MPIPPTTVYRASSGLFAQRGEDFFRLKGDCLDDLFLAEDASTWLEEQIAHAAPVLSPGAWLAPIERQEVWAAGVTYRRSRDARKIESQEAGGGSFYDRVYEAERPEIFFKATPHRVVGHGGTVRLRSDSGWNVPEPEVALAIGRNGKIFGYTIGNDMSSRDIEGENPLYLPQAKVYSACCGLGPGVVVREPLEPTSAIRQTVRRAGAVVSTGATSLDRMKRGFAELAMYLYRDNEFPHGCFLLTGTGIVPANDFTLAAGDEIQIEIEGLGTLLNIVDPQAQPRS
jgi:2-dehydro-3-deoxy-D-arabinonate dehydratase